MTTQYLTLLREIQEKGVFKGDRTGTGTHSLFGAQSRYDLRAGFPLLTTKKMFTRGMIHELLWFIAGDTNVKYLQDNDVNFWNEWALPSGDLGPVYGKQLRHKGINAINLENGRWSGGFDQLAWCIERLKTDPDCRRILISLWAPEEIEDMQLPPCHGIAIQFWTRELTAAEKMDWCVANNVDIVNTDAKPPTRGLSCQTYQRSCDVFLGVPVNIASYALLTHMIAHVVGMVALDLVYVFGDVHIYNNHREQVDLQLTREPKPLPRLWLNPTVKDIDAFTMDDIKVLDYEHHPKIKAEVSV